MWGALRSDLKEFASSIATDSTTIRNEVETKIATTVSEVTNNDDGKIKPNGKYAVGDDVSDLNSNDPESNYSPEAIDEALIRMETEETYTIPLLVNETNGPKKQDTKAASLKANDNHSPSSESDGTAEQGGLGLVDEKSSDQDADKDDPTPVIDGDGWGNDEVKDPLLDDESIADPNKNSDKTEEEEIPIESTDAGEVVEPDTVEQDPVVLEFLESFDIQAQTDDIAMVLSEHEDTVGNHFQNLVPMVVTYEQFWQRYYFRCDPERIQQELDEEDERARKQRQEILDKGKETVKNLFGGALNVMKRGQDSNKEESIYEKYQAELEEKQRALTEGKGTSSTAEADAKKDVTGFGSLFRGARPPFVLNTVVDDNCEIEPEVSDDNSESDYDDDDFGWGSDDDDDDDDDDEDLSHNEADAQSEASEEVVFESSGSVSNLSNSPELETLREELANALQINEDLKKASTQTDQSKSDVRRDESPDDKAELEKLGLELFEKRAELAAIKSTLDEAQDDNHLHVKLSAQTAEMESLRFNLSEKEKELADLKADVDTAQVLQNEEDAKDNQMLAEALETITSLQTELESFKTVAAMEKEDNQTDQETQTNALRNEILQYQHASDEDKNSLADAMSTIISLRDEIEDFKEKLSNEAFDANKYQMISNELDSKNSLLADATDRNVSLQTEVEETKAKLISTNTSHTQETESLQNELAESKQTNQTLQLELETCEANLMSAQAAIVDESTETALSLEAERTIATLKSELDKSRNELTLKIENEDQYQNSFLASKETIASLQSELETSQATLISLQSRQEKESDQHRNALSDSLRNVESLKSELEVSKTHSAQLREELSAAQTNALNAQNMAKESTVIELTEANETILQLQSELDTAKTHASHQVEECNREVKAMKDELKKLESQSSESIQSLNTKIEELYTEKIESEKDIHANETNEFKLKQAQKLNEEELAKQKQQYEVEIAKLRTQLEDASSSSPSQLSSFSSGVAVEEDPNMEVGDEGQQEAGSENDDDGWGDSWSDEDDDK